MITEVLSHQDASDPAWDGSRIMTTACQLLKLLVFQTQTSASINSRRFISRNQARRVTGHILHSLLSHWESATMFTA